MYQEELYLYYREREREREGERFPPFSKLTRGFFIHTPQHHEGDWNLGSFFLWVHSLGVFSTQKHYGRGKGEGRERFDLMIFSLMFQINEAYLVNSFKTI